MYPKPMVKSLSDNEPNYKIAKRSTTKRISDRLQPISHDTEVLCMFCGCCFESALELADHEPSCAAGETDGGNIACHCGRTFVNIDALDTHQVL